MELDAMNKQCKLITLLFIINVGFLIWLLIYFHENQYGLFIVLTTFLSIERFFNYLKNLILFLIDDHKLFQRAFIYLLLCAIYLDWKGHGFRLDDDELEYQNNYFQNIAKKHAQSLNSIPILLIFYCICNNDLDENISIIFFIMVIYIAIFNGCLITSRQFYDENQSFFKLTLYFLINVSAMISYWGLLGQIFYFNIYFLVGVLLIYLLFILFIFKHDIYRIAYNYWKQCFLIKHVYNLSFFDLPEQRNQQLHMACLMSVVHIFLVAFKLAKYIYINEYDILLYIGSCVKLIDIAQQFKNEFFLYIYGPFSYTKQTAFNALNIQKETQNIIKRKFIRNIYIKFNFENCDQQNNKQEIYREFSKYLQKMQLTSKSTSIYIQFEKLIENISMFNTARYYWRFFGVENMFISVIELTLMIAQNIPPSIIKTEIHLNIAFFSELKQYQKIISYQKVFNLIQQPLNVNLKIKDLDIQIVNEFSSDLSQFVNTTIILSKYVFPLINLNPKLISYDLYENY